MRPFGAKCSFSLQIQPGHALLCDVFDFGRTDMQTDEYIGKALCNESY